MTRHPWTTGASVGAIVGLLVAGLMMYIAWNHNAQGEIYNGFGISWGYWLLLGFGWFAPVTIVASLVVGSALSLVAQVRRKSAV